MENTIKIGYSRVSTDENTSREQTLTQQQEALLSYGVSAENLYSEKVSGATNLQQGTEWNKLTSKVQELLNQGFNVEIVVMDWSRVSRNFYKFINLMEEYSNKQVYWTTLNDHRYTMFQSPTQSTDLLNLSIEAFSNQHYREKVSSATKAKLDYLKTQGVQLGRPTKLDETDRNIIKTLHSQGFGKIRIARELSQFRLEKVKADIKQNHYTTSERERLLKHSKISPSLVMKELSKLKI